MAKQISGARSIDGMGRGDDRMSYVMLFCALMLVKNSKATLQESMQLVPLQGSARELAGEIVAHSA